MDKLLGDDDDAAAAGVGKAADGTTAADKKEADDAAKILLEKKQREKIALGLLRAHGNIIPDLKDAASWEKGLEAMNAASKGKLNDLLKKVDLGLSAAELPRNPKPNLVELAAAHFLGEAKKMLC